MNPRAFHVKLVQDEDGWYIASVPALKGCHSQGETRQEALDNIREAIDLWLEAEDARAIAELQPDQSGELVLA